MKRMKKGLSLLLCAIMVLGTVAVGFGGNMPLFGIKAKAAQSHTLIATTSGKGNLYQDDYSARSYPTTDGKGIIVPDDDVLRILQIADPQATAPLYEDLVHLIRQGIARVKPHLIVLTGDNAMYNTSSDSFRNTVGNIVEYFYDEDGKRIPFAATFGNHDTNNNDYSDSADGAGKEIQAQWYYYTKWQGGIDFDYSDVADYGTGTLNVYAANGTTVKQKVFMINSAVNDDNGGYGKMGYNQKGSNGGYNDENCYNELCSKFAAEVNAANSNGVPVIAFQHIPLREMYTANGIVKQASNGIAAYGEIDSDFKINNTSVKNLKFLPDTNSNSKWGDEITDGYCVGVMGEPICCSYSSTEKLYRLLANHPNTKDGYTAHNNVKGIFYGHDHSNTVTGMGYIDYNGERYTLTQGYGGGMDLAHSSGNMPYISAYIIKDDVNANLRKYTWDPYSIQQDYNTTFGAKYTVNGVPSGQTYVCDIAFATKGEDMWDDADDLAHEATSRAANALKDKGYSSVVSVNYALNEDRYMNLNYTDVWTDGTLGDKYIGMAYATSTNVADAYTDIIIRTLPSSGSPQTITKEKYGTTITYSLVSTQALAEGTGGDYNYCYATKDPIAGPPITALGVIETKQDNFAFQGGWYQECMRHWDNCFQDPGDCNSGCGSNTFDVVILTKTIGSPANDNNHCLDSNVTKNYDITNQYYDLAAMYAQYAGKADSYRYTSESWAKFNTARATAKALKEKIDVNRYITETREQVETVTDALETAYNNLQEKPAVVIVDQASSTTNTNDAPVIIAVPETIYLKASSGKATTAEYYLNNSYVNGKLTAETGSSTTGKFSISAKGAASVKITTKQYSSALASVSGLTMTDNGNKNLVNGTATYTPQGTDEKAEGTIGTLTLNPGLDSKATGLLEWQFDVTYQRDDIDGDKEREPVTLTYYAYSVLYAPNNHSVGAITETQDYASSGSRIGQTSFSAWISGIDDLAATQVAFGADSVDGSNYTSASGTFVQDPIVNLSSVKYKGIENSPDSTKLTLSQFLNTSGGNYVNARATKYVAYSSRSGNMFSAAVRGYTGSLYVDSSRYTNLNQVPNFYVGTDFIGSYFDNDLWGNEGSHLYGYYTVAPSDKVSSTAPTYGNKYDIATNLKNITGSDWTMYESITGKGSTNGLNTVPGFNNASGNFILGNPNQGFTNAEQLMEYGDYQEAGIRFYVSPSFAWSASKSGYNLMQAIQTRNYEKWGCATVTVKLTDNNKSTLRELVGNAYNAGLQAKWDTNGTFNTFKTELMNAALKLGTPTDTTNSASALTTAQSNCANGQVGNGTIVNKNYGFRRVIDASTGLTSFYQTKAFDVTSLGTNTTGTATKANWFLTQWADLSNYGYTYIGSKRASELAATVSSDLSSLDLVNTKSRLKSEYMVSTLPNLNAYHYYYSPDYTLTIDMDGGKIGTDSGYTSVIGNEGSTLTASTSVCTKQGYTFVGWQLVSGGGSVSGMTYTFGASNATIKALWKGVTETVTFNPNGGQYNGNIVYLENGEATASDTFWGQGGTLTAVNNGESGISISAQNIASTESGGSNQKIRAYLEYGKSYTLSYTCNLDNSKVYFYILGTENKFTKPGSATEFSSSLIIKNSQGTHIIDNGDGTYTRTMNFTVGESDGTTETNWDRMQTPSDATMLYYLRLDYNNTGVNNFEIENLKIVPKSDATVKIKAITDSEITFYNPTRDGYEFTDWSVNPSDNGTAYSENGITVGTSDTTLTANWDAIEVPIIYYNLDEGENDARNPESYTAGTLPITFYPPKEREGYTFAGWTAEENVTFINDTEEYRKSGAGDFLKYSIPGPFAEGDIYVMECDVKGNGTLDNYFYGDGDYLKVASSVSESEIYAEYRDTQRNANGDGNNHILKDENCTTEGEYKHYTVTFTLSGIGDGSKTKYLMFRSYAGTNIFVKNVVFRKIGEKINDSYTAAHIAKNSKLVMTANFDPNKSTLNVVNNGATTTYSNKDYLSTLDIADPEPRADYIFTGWSLSSNPNGSFENGTYTFGKKAGATDTLTAQWQYVPFNISGSGDNAKINSAAIGFSGTLTPAPIDGITSRTTDESVALNNMNIGASIIDTKDVSITNKIGDSEYPSQSKSVKFYPQTNILFEETAGSFTAGTWSDETGTSNKVNGNNSTVYGYSNNYANNSTYSNGTAKKAISTQGQVKANVPKYEFTFTGTGFDINCDCTDDSGLLTVEVYKVEKVEGKDEETETLLTYWDEDYEEDTPDTRAVNTFYKDLNYGTVMYQVPVVHYENLEYGKYHVICQSPYSPAFDKNYGKAQGASADDMDDVTFTEADDGTTYVDLSSLLGENFAHCKYTEIAEDNGKTTYAGVEIENISPVLVGGDTTPNAYNIIVDSVRIYNPAGVNLSSGDIYNQYNSDNELNPDYSLLRTSLLETSKEILPLTNENGVVYIQPDQWNVSGTELTGGETETKPSNKTADYKKNGSGNEIYLTSGNAIALTIPNGYSKIHLAMRAPLGTSTVVQLGTGTNTITLNTATEMYYDVTNYIVTDTDGNKNLAITVQNGDKSMLAIGSIKVLGSTAKFAPKRTLSALQLGESLVQSAMSNPLTLVDKLTFTVDFGDLGTKEVTVNGENVNYALVDGKWTASAKLSEDELKSLCNTLENKEKYIIDTTDGITLTATLVDGEWVTEKVDVKTTEIPPVIGKTTVNVKFGEIASTSTLIDGKEFTVEKTDGVWTAKSELTVKVLKSLLNNAGIAKKYMLAKEENAAVTAKYIDEKWIVDLVTVDVEKVPAPELTDLEFVVNFGGIAATKYVASKGSLKVEEVGDTYVATDKIGTFKQKSLLKDAGIADEYELAFSTDAAVKATYVDGKWKAEEIYISVVKKGTDTPKAENITFEVAFGDLGTTTIKIDKDDFKYEQIDGVWIATVELTVEDLTKLLEEAGLADKYEITDEGLTLVAKNIDGEWVAEKANANATEQKSTEPEEEWNFWKWLLNIIKSIIEFFKQAFNKIVILIKNV